MNIPLAPSENALETLHLLEFLFSSEISFLFKVSVSHGKQRADPKSELFKTLVLLILKHFQIMHLVMCIKIKGVKFDNFKG